MASAGCPRRGSGTAVSDPGVITAAEWDTAMEFAAADAAEFDADWAALCNRERALAIVALDDYDQDGHYLAPDYTLAARPHPRRR